MRDGYLKALAMFKEGTKGPWGLDEPFRDQGP
jgi:hypothetical protein